MKPYQPKNKGEGGSNETLSKKERKRVNKKEKNFDKRQ
jgi:hypothetical protein